MSYRNNKIILLAICIFSCTVSVLAAERKVDASAQFIKAGEFYKQQNYSGALTIYESLLNVGYQSADLEFNTGNASYKTGQIANAILHFERAYLLDPSNEDISHNLRMAYLTTIDKIEPTPKVFYEKWKDEIISSANLDSRALGAILLFWAAALAFAGYLFITKILIRKIAFYFFIALIVSGCFLLYLSSVQFNHQQHNKGAIIMAESIYVKSAPAAEGSNLFMLHSGTKVEITDELTGWKKIRIANGNEGWIEKDVAEEI